MIALLDSDTIFLGIQLKNCIVGISCNHILLHLILITYFSFTDADYDCTAECGTGECSVIREGHTVVCHMGRKKYTIE